MRAIWGAGLALLCLAGCAEAQRAADPTVAAAKAQVNPTLSASDATFMTTATRGGLAEMQMGHLAQRNGGLAAVRRYGERMAADHGRANREMLALAQRKQITPPETMGAEHQAMVEDHQEDLRLYREEAANGTDPDVRGFAQRHVPVLEEHLRMAQQLARR